ncbi:MAG TPA: DEAD/DEAH box helicase [Polyangiaceae bacterium]|nr:DEAD/DEAH box helicase [Polyangiaceae bacterium]
MIIQTIGNESPVSPHLSPAAPATPLAFERFDELGIHPALLRALGEEGYTAPTPIQRSAIPHVMAGKDLLGCAQTGTGKTAAFALPILQRLLGSRGEGEQKRQIRALVLSPTRELAAQIGESFQSYGRHTGLRAGVIFGGVSQYSQEQVLRRGVDILVATPGRLIDLMSQRLVPLPKLEVFVLDEADRMLDMGFLPAVKRVIAALPSKRQTLFFSATMPTDIESLANSILSSPVRVAVTPVASTADKIAQSIYFVGRGQKSALLEHVLQDRGITRALVFTRTKRGANQVAQRLTKASIRAEAIHGNKSQSARTRALALFKAGSIRVLVATDIAARGIDVESISHVVNYELPEVPETYVHRIGRTARAGAQGAALSFCDSTERSHLRGIERLIRMPVPVVAEHPYTAAAEESASRQERAPQQQQRSRQGSFGRRRR